MKKNVASQSIGCQLISKTDGSAVTTGTTTVYVCGDAGTQAAGSVGSGACTHEGNGYWTYAPAQAETNYDLIAFTFVNTSACNATVQVYTTYPQTGDNYARLGAPAGASVSADVAAIKSDSGAIKTKTDYLPSATAGAAGGVFIAGTNAATTVTTSFTTTFTGNLTGSVNSVATDVGITQAAADKAWSTAARTLTAGTNIVLAKGTGITGFNDLDAAGVAAATWNAATASYGTAGTYGALVETNLDVANSTRMASYTQPTGFLAATFPTTVPTAAQITTAVWDEAIAGHLTAGTTGEKLNSAGAAGDPWATALPGAYGAGTAGKIIGDNINATLSSKASQASVDAVAAEAAVIKAKTDSLTFTVAGQVDCNMQSINDVTITGNGGVTPFNV